MAQGTEIPDFDDNGNLPEGVYPCDAAVLESRYVIDFPQSNTRRSIYDGFMQFRSDAAAHGISGTQWADGSFVTNKQDPSDVDVVTFCDVTHLNGLNATAQEFVLQSIAGKETAKIKYRTHAFLVPSCHPNAPYFPIFEQARAYWRTWFGKTRDIPNPPGPDLPGRLKGFVQMSLGEAGKAPQISTERSAK